jgi:hypothetical protein
VSRPALLSRWKRVALLSAGSVLFFWQLGHPLVRFASPVVNELVGFAFALGLPWLTLVAFLSIGRWWSSAVGTLAFVLLVLYTALLLLGETMTAYTFKDGRALSFDCFEATVWKDSQVRLYRTNGGATTDFGVVIQQEKGLLPGILLVRRLDFFSHCEALEATSTDTGIAVEDKDSDCRGFYERHREYALKRSVYF